MDSGDFYARAGAWLTVATSKQGRGLGQEATLVATWSMPRYRIMQHQAGIHGPSICISRVRGVVQPGYICMTTLQSYCTVKLMVHTACDSHVSEKLRGVVFGSGPTATAAIRYHFAIIQVLSIYILPACMYLLMLYSAYTMAALYFTNAQRATSNKVVVATRTAAHASNVYVLLTGNSHTYTGMLPTTATGRQFHSVMTYTLELCLQTGFMPTARGLASL